MKKILLFDATIFLKITADKKAGRQQVLKKSEWKN